MLILSIFLVTNSMNLEVFSRKTFKIIELCKVCLPKTSNVSFVCIQTDDTLLVYRETNFTESLLSFYQKYSSITQQEHSSTAIIFVYCYSEHFQGRRFRVKKRFIPNC